MRLLVTMTVALAAAFAAAGAQAKPLPPLHQWCHYKTGSANNRRELVPDPHCTPGMTDPAVTQANLQRTVCNANWLRAREQPQVGYWGQRIQSMQAYGVRDPSWWAYDHLIPVSIGGSMMNPWNLWPQPLYAAFVKDGFERRLHRTLCYGGITLKEAQRVMATAWWTAS